MCKFNLIDAISTSIDPLSGWLAQKQPQSGWEYPLLAPAALDEGAPPLAPSVGTDAGIPDDLQDLLLDSPESVPALPGDDANTLLEDLISGSVRENPELFGDVSPLSSAGSTSLDGDGMIKPAPMTQPQQPGFALSPSPQQVSLESWVPTLSPASCEPGSPLGFADSPMEPLPGPDWSPCPAAPPSSRRTARPRPYDKPARRQHLTEEERRLRKKEQNKNAATRYRQKKKEEHDLISSDQETLETRNKQLRARVGSLTKELLYLKQLMREVLRHKQAAV